ncbi:MAG TPA: DUF763 domain-containing protein [Calditrichaeota bacterium]|nr:DUF763 domain-containing protein [Calditrichota bacterium]
MLPLFFQALSNVLGLIGISGSTTVACGVLRERFQPGRPGFRDGWRER